MKDGHKDPYMGKFVNLKQWGALPDPDIRMQNDTIQPSPVLSTQ